ncbi:unnamed protein product, partial [Medioppia subpectinata]
MDDMQLSGLDMLDKPYVFHLDQNNPQSSLRLCVKKCPPRELSSLADIYSFYTRTQSSLCRYDYNFTSTAAQPLEQQFQRNDHQMNSLSSTGPCPTLPVHSTKAILYRCIPELAILQGQAFGHTIYEFISSYVPLKKVINDLINAYREISYSVTVAIVFAFVSAFV